MGQGVTADEDGEAAEVRTCGAWRKGRTQGDLLIQSLSTWEGQLGGESECRFRWVEELLALETRVHF